MARRLGPAVAAALIAFGVSPAWPDQSGPVSEVLQALRFQGYREIWFERTLLNRIRIVAERRGRSREIVIDPRTGEILRDYSAPPAGQVPEGDGDAILRHDEGGSSRDDADSPRAEREEHEAEDGGEAR